MKEPGFIYILTNPSFREDWVKIGKSMRPVNIRSKELDNTAVPLPFEIFATMRTVKYDKVEKFVHKTIDRLTDLRIRQNREFFNIAPKIALDILKDIAQTIDDAVIVEYFDNKPIKEYSFGSDATETAKEHTEIQAPPESPKTRKGRFKFSIVGIGIGEFLTFTPTGIQVKVASDDTVEYQNRIYKLSPFVGTFMPEDKRNTSGAYQGAIYFEYNGERLIDMRARIEGTPVNENDEE